MSRNRYDRMIEEVFLSAYSEGASSVEFSRDELEKAAEGKEWVIRLAGRSTYRFELREHINLTPSRILHAMKVPDATPGIVEPEEAGNLVR